MTFANLAIDFATLVVFLIIIAVLVAAHEWGHYFFARVFGMGVEEFAIGMGKKVKIWRRKPYDIPVADDYVHVPRLDEGMALEGGNRASNARLVDTPTGRVLRDETEFTVRMLPLGGFVRIKGMIPHEDASETKIPGGFYSKPPWQRLIVLIAGPAASVVAGLLVLVLVYMTHGEQRPVDSPVVGGVREESPAFRAGLRKGDRIVSMAGQPINTFYDAVQATYSNAGKRIPFVFEHEGKIKRTMVTPEIVDGPTMTPDLEISPDPVKHGVIGVAPQVHLVVLPFGTAVREAVAAPIDAIGGIFRIAEKPSRIKDEAGGVLTMAAVTHGAVEDGLGQIFWVAAMLSISIGIFNLIPFPPLDGGQMAIAFAELLRGGRRLSLRVQEVVMSAGFVLVLILAGAVLWVDFQRFTGSPDPPATHQPAKKPAK